MFFRWSGLNPLPVGGNIVLCETMTNLVVCLDDTVSGDGGLILAPDEPPVCIGGQTIIACLGASVTLPALDPDDDPLSYSWSTDCAGGSFNSATASMPTFSFGNNPNCSGMSCGVTLVVTGNNADAGSVSVTCTATVTDDPTFPIF